MRSERAPMTLLRDLAASGALVLIQVGVTLQIGEHQPDRRQVDALAVALLAAGPVALFWRRRRPVPVLAAVSLVTLTYLLRGYPYGPFALSFAVAVLSAVVYGRRPAAWTAAAVVYLGHFVLGPLAGWRDWPGPSQLIAVATWFFIGLAGGEVIRIRREQALHAARTRAEADRRRASEERLRIARELHDVLAHNISLINVQAGVALHLLDERPEGARPALTAIKQASRDALGELRSVLDVLRRVDEDAPREPTPGLDRLPDLVARTNAAGVPVRTEVHGEPRPLPAGVDLAAFRVVQEALTNVARHAGRATVTVRVTYAADQLAVTVTDDGRGAGHDTSGGGNGIPGMRERITALGGRLEVGPRPEGGYAVRALLPLEAP